MTRGGPLLRAAIGAAASLGLHGAGALAVLALVAPEPVPNQPVPRSKIDLETVALSRSDARERPAEGAEAAGVTPDARLAPGQGVPRRDAAAVAAPFDRASAEIPAGPAMAALTPGGENRPALDTPGASAPALPPTGAAAPGAPTPARPAAGLSAPSVAVAAGEPPAPSATASVPRAEAAPSRPPDGARAGSVSPAGPVAAAMAPPERDALGPEETALPAPSLPPSGRPAQSAAARGRAATSVAALGGAAPEGTPEGSRASAVDAASPAVEEARPEDRSAPSVAASGTVAVALDEPEARARASEAAAPTAQELAARGQMAAVAPDGSPVSRPVSMIAAAAPSREPPRPLAVAFRPDGLRVGPAPPQGAAAPQRRPLADAATAEPPEAYRVDPADIGKAGTAAPPRAPAERAAASTAPDAPPAPTASGTGPTLGAALEWSGAGTLDPASLDALSAFLPAERRGAAGEAARDGIAALMASVPCSRLRVEFDAEAGALELHGHVPDAAARAPLAAALQAQVGESLPVRDALRVLPEPQCGVLSGMAATGLPQSEEEFTDPEIVGESAWARDFAFEGGARLVIDLEPPDYPAYLYVDYYDANGDVLHLTPNTESPLRRTEPEAPVSVGRDDGLELRIAPPYGQDIVVALAVDQPLYDGLRPVVEPADAYLTFLGQRLAELGDYRGEWVYLFVETMPPRQ